MTKFKSKALHIIRIKYYNAGESGNPPSLIPALRNTNSKEGRAQGIHEPIHGLRTPGEEIAFTARPKINSHSQIFRYGQSIFCLPHRPKFSDLFDLCFHLPGVRSPWTNTYQKLRIPVSKTSYFFIGAAFRFVFCTTANISLLATCIPALFIAIITIINKINSVIAKGFLNKL